MARWVYAAAVLLLPSPARAVDPFEVQVYDGTAVNRDAFAIELHTNGVVRGPDVTSPSPVFCSGACAPMELPMNHQLHFTLEPQYGVFSWWEVGGYFQTAFAGGSFDFAGVKFRSKWVTPPGLLRPFRFGLNMEVSMLPIAFDQNIWGMELRPIAAFENKYVMFVVNPIIDVTGRPPGGTPTPKDPTFEPAATLVYKWDERASLGVEWYGNFGPVSGFVPVAQQEQYLYAVVNVLAVKNIEINLGFGEGLTAASNHFVAKMIVGYTWEHVLRR
jgi:hypothetical protein